MKTPKWFLHRSLIPFLLLPFAFIYYGLARAVFFLRKSRQYKSKRPVICIGNILSGGVGKTPIVRTIANYLKAPVVMRGYKKNTKTNNVGDEALMLSKSGLQIHTGNRKSNLILLNKQENKKLPIVLDDGFQNPTIRKDVSILVFDEEIGYGNGFLIPSGPLREPKSAIKRADAIIVIRSKNPQKKFVLPKNIPIFYAKSQTVSPYVTDEKLFAFAGIGYPKKFFSSLKNVVGKKSFPDHYLYGDNDIKHLLNLAKKRDALLITTEKDWIKLPEYAKNIIKYANLDISIEDRFFDWLKEKI